MPPQLWIGLAILGALLLFGWLKRRSIMLWIMRGETYNWFCRWILPKLKYRPCRGLTGRQYHKGYNLLKAGDVVLDCTYGKLSYWLTPGEWAHARFCVGKDSPREMIHAVAAGVEYTTFYNTCKTSHRVCILRPVVSPGYRLVMIERGLALVGRPYDRQFTLDDKGAEVYCSEAPILTDPENRMGVNRGPLPGVGHPCVLPDDLYEAKGMEVIWDSEWPECFTGKLSGEE